ncbi:MAG: glycoside hydrolase family 13 protein [Anaerolineales bacterium]|nr:glycoside hydrolase family 13 protein [Anaerolineales bacterium]
MTHPDWVQDAVFYQIFPDRFARSKRLPDLEFEPWDTPPTYHGFKGGDLYGIAERLDYLSDLGITALYLNPVFASASNHRYHTYDYFNVDPLLGGNEALRFLVDEAHNRNIRVVLDGVFNHASRGFWQFHHVLENGNDSPYKNWFYFDPERLQGRRRWGAYPATGELHALKNGEGSLKALGYQAWWDLPALPKFNTSTPAVREYLFGVAEHWIRFGIDGWRLDVPAEIDDDSFWQEFRRRVKTINPDTYIVGEIWHEAQRWLGGDQFDAVMNYLITAAVMSFCGSVHIDMNIVNQAGGLQGRVHPNMDAIWFANELDRLTNLYSPEITRSQLNLFDSHDMPRFLTCVGNDVPSLQLAMLFMFTYPGAPCLYYGDEVGLTGSHDPDCRKGFPWDASRWDHNLLNYTKAVIALRKEHQALRRGSYQRLYSEGQVFAFGRKLDEQSFIIILNAGEDHQKTAFSVETFNANSSVPSTVFGPDTHPYIENKTFHIEISSRNGVVIRL